MLFVLILGKSLHIERLELEVKRKNRQCERVIHRLYDRHVDFEKLLDFLWTHKDLKVPTIVHLDVSPNVSSILILMNFLKSIGVSISNVASLTEQLKNGEKFNNYFNKIDVIFEGSGQRG